MHEGFFSMCDIDRKWQTWSVIWNAVQWSMWHLCQSRSVLFKASNVRSRTEFSYEMEIILLLSDKWNGSLYQSITIHSLSKKVYMLYALICGNCHPLAKCLCLATLHLLQSIPCGLLIGCLFFYYYFVGNQAHCTKLDPQKLLHLLFCISFPAIKMCPHIYFFLHLS